MPQENQTDAFDSAALIEDAERELHDLTVEQAAKLERLKKHWKTRRNAAEISRQRAEDQQNAARQISSRLTDRSRERKAFWDTFQNWPEGIKIVSQQENLHNLLLQSITFVDYLLSQSKHFEYSFQNRRTENEKILTEPERAQIVQIQTALRALQANATRWFQAMESATRQKMDQSVRMALVALISKKGQSLPRNSPKKGVWGTLSRWFGQHQSAGTDGRKQRRRGGARKATLPNTMVPAGVLRSGGVDWKRWFGWVPWWPRNDQVTFHPDLSRPKDPWHHAKHEYEKLLHAAQREVGKLVTLYNDFRDGKSWLENERAANEAEYVNEINISTREFQKASTQLEKTEEEARKEIDAVALQHDTILKKAETDLSTMKSLHETLVQTGRKVKTSLESLNKECHEMQHALGTRDQAYSKSLNQSSRRSVFPKLFRTDTAKTIASEFPELQLDPITNSDARQNGCKAQIPQALSFKKYQQLIPRLLQPKSPYLGFLAAFDTGAGKTALAINTVWEWFASELKDVKRNKATIPPVLILLPPGLVQTWVAEFRKWLPLAPFDHPDDIVSVRSNNETQVLSVDLSGHCRVVLHSMHRKLPPTETRLFVQTSASSRRHGVSKKTPQRPNSIYGLARFDPETHPAYASLSSKERHDLAQELKHQVDTFKSFETKSSLAVPKSGLVIVDEAYNLVDSQEIASNATEAMTVLEWANQMTPLVSPDMKRLFLTATPFNAQNPTVTFKLLNLLIPAEERQGTPQKKTPLLPEAFEGSWRKTLIKAAAPNLKELWAKATHAENQYLRTSLFHRRSWRSEEVREQFQQRYAGLLFFVTLENDASVFPSFDQSCRMTGDGSCTLLWQDDALKRVTSEQLLKWFHLPIPTNASAKKNDILGQTILVPLSVAQSQKLRDCIREDIRNVKTAKTVWDLDSANKALRSSLYRSIGVQPFASKASRGKKKQTSSPKLDVLFHLMAQRKNEKFFAFAQFSDGHVARPIVQYLETVGEFQVLKPSTLLKYDNFKTEEARPLKEFVDMFYNSVSKEKKPAQKRMIFFITNATENGLVEKANRTMAMMKERLQAIWNDPRNNRAEYIQGFFGSLNSKEGLSLLHTKNAVLLDEPANPNLAKQSAARIRRFCSFADFPTNEWNDLRLWYLLSIQPNTKALQRSFPLANKHEGKQSQEDEENDENDEDEENDENDEGNDHESQTDDEGEEGEDESDRETPAARRAGNGSARLSKPSPRVKQNLRNAQDFQDDDEVENDQDEDEKDRDSDDEKERNESAESSDDSVDDSESSDDGVVDDPAERKFRQDETLTNEEIHYIRRINRLNNPSEIDTTDQLLREALYAAAADCLLYGRYNGNTFPCYRETSLNPSKEDTVKKNDNDRLPRSEIGPLPNIDSIGQICWSDRQIDVRFDTSNHPVVKETYSRWREQLAESREFPTRVKLLMKSSFMPGEENPKESRNPSFFDSECRTNQLKSLGQLYAGARELNRNFDALFWLLLVWVGSNHPRVRLSQLAPSQIKRAMVWLSKFFVSEASNRVTSVSELDNVMADVMLLPDNVEKLLSAVLEQKKWVFELYFSRYTPDRSDLKPCVINAQTSLNEWYQWLSAKKHFLAVYNKFRETIK